MNIGQTFLNSYNRIKLFFSKVFSQRKIIFLTPLILWLLNQLFLWRPRMFSPCSWFLIAVTVMGLTAGKRQADWPLFFYFPFIFFLSSSLYSTLLPNFYVIQIIFFFANLYIFSYFKNLYYFFRYEAPERAHKLDTLTLLGNFLAVFFLASTIYGLPTFLGWSFWPLLFGFIILSIPLFSTICYFEIKLKINWPLIIASALVLLELAAIIHFLPLAYNVLGLFVGIFFYLLIYILRNILAGDLSGYKLRLPLVFACQSLLSFFYHYVGSNLLLIFIICQLRKIVYCP